VVFFLGVRGFFFVPFPVSSLLFFCAGFGKERAAFAFDAFLAAGSSFAQRALCLGLRGKVAPRAGFLVFCVRYTPSPFSAGPLAAPTCFLVFFCSRQGRAFQSDKEPIFPLPFGAF